MATLNSKQLLHAAYNAYNDEDVVQCAAIARDLAADHNARIWRRTKALILVAAATDCMIEAEKCYWEAEFMWSDLRHHWAGCPNERIQKPRIASLRLELDHLKWMLIEEEYEVDAWMKDDGNKARGDGRRWRYGMMVRGESRVKAEASRKRKSWMRAAR
ncbi:unnamed protein product [Zymoseptoria tritici ST99CH_1A5]|uniref:Uncharacterized protein n=1 Tax=Zymoseptoria tritici ST99CH_1A5 TaxID=1276529 RepID=A0A1Y6LIG3_ZYMTR|nr:unnamed protein product [Zymoseptoria tritici ST99CH_1A5]